MLEKIRRMMYKVAIYIRLSKEDADRGYDESESITNQKKLLLEYVEKLGWEYELVDLYIDPGYTGTNFNRPAFKKMIEDIRAGKVNMVITKDLSRLGRDYIETGEYIEKWFPEHNIRYVSVTDGIDTFVNNANNDIAPFKAILNDMYSKDLSKKIKTALHTMQKEGKWVGGKTPLGYIKDPSDKNKLIICEEEAEIVKTIFNMALEGNTVATIREYLDKNEIPTPNQIRYNKATFWENKTIKGILKNEIYVGTTIQNRRSRISYKNRKLRPNPEDEWNIAQNTHEPIIEKEVFSAIQKMVIVERHSRNEKKHIVLLDGLMFCYECKHKIGLRMDKQQKYYMVCNNYRRYSKLGICTSHGFSYSRLEEKVLKYIKEIFLKLDDNKIESNIKNRKNPIDYSKMINKLEIEINLVNENIDKMYIDKLNNNISDVMYDRLFSKLTNEIKEKEEKITELKELYEKDNDLDNTKQLKKVIKDFLSLEKPTRELMKVIINRIEIHQNKQIDIKFNFKKLNFFSDSNCLN